MALTSCFPSKGLVCVVSGVFINAYHGKSLCKLTMACSFTLTCVIQVFYVLKVQYYVGFGKSVLRYAC